MRFNKKAGTIALLLLVCVPAPSTASGNLISQEPSRRSVFARDNMSSPGISTTIAFSEDTELQLKYRLFNIHKSGDSRRLNGAVLENSAF